ncbi:hypothetical protein F511_29561 [Dorcoceras hygrometricum]|uniref:Uncharacterized protein n=1 Tax=Dorcoceras hygrometricum TaxID=472368 RepID=A0A2Z7DDW7_9LAMI|nr:hypothetical protein F511_29561 [Dorcoceras hygrometricum]
MKIQYRLLHDILAKTIYVKAGSFDSVTRDRFMLMTAITFDVKINWGSLLFGVLREMLDSADIQSIQEFESASSDGSTVYRSPSPILQEDDSSNHDFQFALGSVIPVTAQEEQFDSQMNFDTTDFPLDDTTEAQTSLPAAAVEAIDDLRAFILQRIDDSNSAILSKLHTLERGLRDALHDQHDNARKLINGVCQDAHTISDVQKIHLNDVKKIVLAQGDGSV